MLQDISYVLPNQEVLFQNIHITVNSREKLAIIGNNGTGKSTLFKIISGELKPHSGQIDKPDNLYYVPQVLDQYHHLTVAEALNVADKLFALKQILEGKVAEEFLSVLNDDWTLEERCQEAFELWKISDLDLSQKMSELSGGQRTKVLLSGIYIHEAKFVLLDEPTNHLDGEARKLLYDFVGKSSCTILLISHDRTLLNLVDRIAELSKKGITLYGGNFEFYSAQKKMQTQAFEQDLLNKEKELRKAREKERETAERQQKLDARGKKKQEKAGVARIMMNTLKNKAENSTSKLKGVHEDKISGISDELRDLRTNIPDIDKMKFGFTDSALHKGKVLFSAEELNWKYSDKNVWAKSLNIRIESGERIAIKGANGSGKSTLMKIILGEINAENVYRADCKVVYIDQDYTLLDNAKTVFQQVSLDAIPEHEVKMNLHRLLFTKDDWDKPCSVLSGGERMRLILCGLTLNAESPDMIILDEPTNNLDIQNIEILTRAIQQYKGTLLVISHDPVFMEEIGIEREIVLLGL